MAEALLRFRTADGQEWIAAASIGLASGAVVGQGCLDLAEAEELGAKLVDIKIVLPNDEVLAPPSNAL